MTLMLLSSLSYNIHNIFIHDSYVIFVLFQIEYYRVLNFPGFLVSWLYSVESILQHFCTFIFYVSVSQQQFPLLLSCHFSLSPIALHCKCRSLHLSTMPKVCSCVWHQLASHAPLFIIIIFFNASSVQPA